MNKQQFKNKLRETLLASNKFEINKSNGCYNTYPCQYGYTLQLKPDYSTFYETTSKEAVLNSLITDLVNEVAEIGYPSSKPEMNFTEALKHFNNGKSIRRKAWLAHEALNLNHIIRNAGNDGIVVDDMRAEDWEIVE